MTDLKSKAIQEAARLERKFGHKAGGLGSERFKLDVIPTGILSLDYALGTGGWPRGHMVEVFGPPDIGKSSCLGLNAMANAQRQGLLCGLVALEPTFDPDWAEKHGVDPDLLVVGRPNNGQEAFEMLHEWIHDDIIDFILFDSVGALLRESEAKQGGKASQGGQSGLVTWGVKHAVMPVWKNNKSVILLNQIRDDMDSMFPGVYDSPGGHALKHLCAVRVQLRQSGKAYTAKVEGDDVVIGRTIVGTLKRNKMSEGSMKKAEFDYYLMDTEDSAVGIDIGKDVVTTGMRTGVIEKAGGWFRHSTFPGGKLQGKPAVTEFVKSHPKAYQQIREEVLAVMLKRQGEVKSFKPDLEVLESGKAGE